MTNLTKIGASTIAAAVLALSGAGSALAAGNTGVGFHHMDTGVAGKISAINGTVISITDHQNVVYTSNISGVTIYNNINNVGSMSDLHVGDAVFVQGVVGTNTVTSPVAVFDGKFSTGIKKNHESPNRVKGVVTAINGSILTVMSQKSNTSYSVDATSARVIKGAGLVNGHASDVSVGDKIIATGTGSGTSVLARIVIDGGTK